MPLLRNRSGFKLFLTLLILILIVVIQLTFVNRLRPQSKYPWEDDVHSIQERELDHGQRIALPTQDKHSNHSNNIYSVLVGNSANNRNVNDQDISANKDKTTPLRDGHNSAETVPQVFCDITSKDALSAIDRAKTESCRNTIRNITCQIQAKSFYDTKIVNSCPIGRNPAKTFKFIPYEEGVGPAPRVVFLLSLHGRSVRQVMRLFKAIYHTDHYYYIHVDSRSEYLHREIAKTVKSFDNVYLPTWRMATIWGGASLLQMLLKSLNDLEYILTDWKWDFLINLSESDYPLKTNDELVKFLRVHRHSNFVKTHGGDINKFIQKQGLDRTFVECENHMWRVGTRPLPPDITLDGGSDWIVINRNYSHYLVTNTERFLTSLKKYYEYSLLPAESFFHTVLRNGPYCETFVRTNLRITNWNRKLGCRCQYKHIVDWCGCSPNDFLPKDISRLMNSGDHHFFARKFEAIVNQDIIKSLDEYLYGRYDPSTPGLTSYWENIYHIDDDIILTSSVHYTVYQSFLRLSQGLVHKLENGNQSASSCPLLKSPTVKELHVYYKDDRFVGYIMKYGEPNERGNDGQGFMYEAFLTPNRYHTRQNANNDASKRIIDIQVGSVWDGKESIFRNYGGILGVNDDFGVALYLSQGRLVHVDILWLNPVKGVVSTHDLKLEPTSTVMMHKLEATKPLMPGQWEVRVATKDGNVIVEETFMVSPVLYHKRQLLENPAEINAKHSNDLQVGTDVQKYLEWKSNIIKSGKRLENWIDTLVGEFWSVINVCSAGGCSSLPSCDQTTWSTLSPDLKSELGPIQSNGRIR